MSAWVDQTGRAEITSQRVLKDGLAAFGALVDGLRPLLDRLIAAPACPRLEHGRGRVPKRPGVYLFSEPDGRPLYVGQSRNLNLRLGQHCQPGSGLDKASFAFNLAKREASAAGVLPEGFRAEVERHEDFAAHFDAAKERVAAMPVQFTLATNPHLRKVFEVYATVVLDTHEFNRHETH